jgi:hypothetical protein
MDHRRKSCFFLSKYSLQPEIKDLWPWCPPLAVTHHEESLKQEIRKTYITSDAHIWQ